MKSQPLIEKKGHFQEYKLFVESKHTSSFGRFKGARLVYFFKNVFFSNQVKNWKTSKTPKMAACNFQTNDDRILKQKQM